MLPLCTNVREARSSAIVVLQGPAHQALRSLGGDRFHADPAVVGKTDLVHAHFVAQERDDLVGLGAVRCPFDTRVYVLGVLAKDDHVRLLRRQHGARNALQPAHRTLTDVKIQHLSDRDVQRADTAADGGRHGTLDGDAKVAQRLEGFLGQPLVVPVDRERLFARIDLHPGDGATATVALCDRGVDYIDHDRRDVDADAVALDERNDGTIRNVQAAVFGHGDPVSVVGDDDVLVTHRYSKAKGGKCGARL